MRSLSTLFHKNSLNIKWILLFFVIVYHGFLFYSLKHQPVNLRDSVEYLNSASSFEDEANFYAGPPSADRDYRLYSKRTPLYPLVLHSLNKLHLHRNYIYLLQLFLGLSSILLTFIFISHFVKKTFFPYLFLSIFLIFTPSQFIYSQFIMADLWLQFFVMLVLFSYLQFHKTQRIAWLIGIVIWSTLAALTKPVFLLASFGCSLVFVWHIIKNKRKQWVVLVALVPFLSWGLICNQNNKWTGVFHYSSIGYINLLHYNTNLYLQSAIGPSEASKKLEPLMLVPHSKIEFKKQYNQTNEVCKQVIVSNFFGYTLFHLKGMAYFFLDPGRFDLYQFFRVIDTNTEGFLNQKPGFGQIQAHFKRHPKLWVYLGLIFCFNLLKTIGFLGFILIHRKNKVIILAAMLVFYIAFLTGPLGASRFALPVALIAMCAAAIFYANLCVKFLQRQSELKSKKITNL